jgi:hypothetical protein
MIIVTIAVFVSLILNVDGRLNEIPIRVFVLKERCKLVLLRSMIGIWINVLVQAVVSLLMTLDRGLKLGILVIIWGGSVLLMRVVVNVKLLNPVVVV